MPAKGSETLLIKRAEKDRYGDEGPAVLVATSRQAILWPRASSETSDRGIVTIEGFHVFVPTGQTTWEAGVPEEAQHLRSTDIIEARGKRWNLEGAVGDWRKKTGKKIGFMFEIERRTGV